MKIRLSLALVFVIFIFCIAITRYQSGENVAPPNCLPSRAVVGFPTYLGSPIASKSVRKVTPNRKVTDINVDSLKSTNWYGTIRAELEQQSFYFDSAVGNKASSINITQHLESDYDATGFSISPWQASAETECGTEQKNFPDKDWQLGLRIRGLYADGRLISKPALNNQRQLVDSELSYRSDVMTVQYQNTKAGIRQNFIVEKSPGATARELRVSMQASKGWVVLKSGDREVQFAKRDAGILQPKLVYNDLRVWDASGKKLSAHMDAQGRDLAIVVDASGAKYPVTIDPLAYGSTPAAFLSPAGTLGSDPKFGSSVMSAGDVNGDGYSDVAVLGGGMVSVYQGSSTGLSMFSANPTTIIKFNDPYSNVIRIGAMASGDVNGDGFSDVIVTAAGKAYVFQGSANGLPATPTTTVTNSTLTKVATAGDVNGDGFSDVILSGSTDHYIYQGSAAGLNSVPTTTLLNSAYPIVVLVTAGDVNGDGYGDVIAGHQYAASGTGVAYLFLGSAGGLSATAATTLTNPTGTSGEEFGCSVARAGDVNGDGYGDVVIGAQYATTSSQYINQGKAYVFMGSASGLSSSPATLLTGPNSSYDYKFGWAVAGVGDINGDGYSDIIVGDQLYPLGPTYQNGLACIFNGSATGTVATPSQILNDPGLLYASTTMMSDFFSASLASAGDINGDGYSDIIAGAPGTYMASNGAAQGRAYVFLGVPDNVAPAISNTLNGAAAGDQFGIGISSAGDVNADGYNDVIVGANQAGSNQGRAYLYLGSANGLPTTASAVISDPGATSGDRFGVAVAGVGDVNGDGYGDIVVGAPGVLPGSVVGKAYVYYGNAGGIAASPALTLTDPGADNANRFGRFVAGAGDINGDGYSDVLISAFGALSNHGAAYVYYGSATGLPTSPSLTLNDPANGSNDSFGNGISTAGDVNGDGYSDVLIYGGNMAYLYNGSLGGLSTTPATSVAATSTAISSAGDVNGDGYSDVVVSTSNGFSMYPGSANGLSATGTSISGSGAVAGAGDVNGDGYSDVVSSSPGGVNIYPGSENGLIATPITRTYNLSFGKLAAAGDVNGDGYSDVLGGNSGAASNQGVAYIVSGNGGYGKHNNMLRLFENDLINPLKASNANASTFGIGLFVNPFPGVTKARLVWETEANGTGFQHYSPITNYAGYTAAQATYTIIPPGGIELKALVNKVGNRTKIRVRVQYQKAASPGGQVFGPWVYPQAYLNGLMGSGVPYFSTTPLPIKLISFTAAKVGDANKLEWSTATETAGSTFLVQRSGDEIVFTTISERIQGTGHNSHYSFYDKTPLYPVAYYRLKGTEPDGSVTYSKIVAVHRTGNSGHVVLSPVPASATVTVSNTNAALNRSVAIVFDMQGREVYRFTLSPSSTIDVSKWNAGIYNVRLADGTLLKMVKL